MVKLNVEETKGLTKAEVAALRAKKEAEEEAEKDEQKRLYQEILDKKKKNNERWAVGLMLGPVPYLAVRLASILYIALALNIPYYPCNQPLQNYLTGMNIFTYVILFFYGWLWFPPFFAFKQLKTIQWFARVYAVTSTGWAVYGLLLIMPSKSCMNWDKSPWLYLATAFELAVHFLALFVCGIYLAIQKYQDAHAEERARKLEEKRADMEYKKQLEEAEAAKELELKKEQDKKDAEEAAALAEEAKQKAMEEEAEKKRKAQEAEQKRLDELYADSDED
eukprot:g79.t1